MVENVTAKVDFNRARILDTRQVVDSFRLVCHYLSRKCGRA
jgi:hypothetical protein